MELRALILFISFTLALSFNCFADGEDCVKLLTSSYTLEAKTAPKFGTEVVIRGGQNEPVKAYYLGMSSGRAYFAQKNPDDLINQIFFLPVEEVGINKTTNFLVELHTTHVPNACAPKSTMACLEHLEKIHKLSSEANAILNSARSELFQTMVELFSREAIEKRPEVIELDEQLQIETDAKKRKQLAIERRDIGHRTLVDLLSSMSVPTQITTSYRALFRHLSKGLPAYISSSVTALSSAQGHLDGSEQKVVTGTVPIPNWFPTSMSHAVYAMGFVPRAQGFYGLLFGKRIVIIDPETHRLALWPANQLRLTGDARFILIGK